MLLLAYDRILGSRRTQVALENAKQRIARRYLAVFQKVEDRGKRLRFCLRIDRFSQVLILSKFCVALLFDRFEFRLQDSQSFQLMHDSHHAPPATDTLLQLLLELRLGVWWCARGDWRVGGFHPHSLRSTLVHRTAGGWEPSP